jgi:hypothetical protein
MKSTTIAIISISRSKPYATLPPQERPIPESSTGLGKIQKAAISEITPPGVFARTAPAVLQDFR